MSTPKQNSTPAGLSAAQGLYYNQLTSGGQNAQETLDYVKSLNDLQSLASLANTQGKFADIAQGTSSEQIQDLESLYQAPIITYSGRQTRDSTFRPAQSAADTVIPSAPIVETTPLIKSNDTGMTAQPLYTSLTASSTPAQIAAAYSQLAAGAGGDTAANQTEAVAYLQKLGISDATIMAGYNQYLNPLSQVTQSDGTGTGTGTGTVTGALDIANTAGLGTTGIGVNTATGLKVDDEVADTFKTVFGRAPTEGELTSLRDKYGYTIEPGELNQIVLSKRDANVGYGVATTQTVTPVYGVKEIIDENGELAQVNTITGYKDQNGNSVDPSLVTSDENFGFIAPAAATNFTVEGGTINKLTNQILGQDTTKYWSGEGYGSAQNSAADMALLLASIGIKDINEFGKVTVAADAAVTPIYEQKLMNDGEGGTYMGNVLVGYKDASGKAVDPSQVKTSYDEFSGTTEYLAPVGTKEVFGNKVTGQALDSHYAKADDNIFSGTFAGEGSTGYGVKFKEDGSPIFYTQFMGSSNDLAQLLEDPLIGAIVQAAASYFGGPIGTAALNLAAGRDADDVAKAALTSWVAGQVGSYVSGAESVVDALGQTGANIAGNVAGSVAAGGGKEGALQALVTGGVNLALPEVTNLIPGYENLSSTQKSFVNNIVSNTLRDGDLSASDIINAAVTSGKEAVRTAIGDKLGETAFVESKRTGASDDEAFDASKALTSMAETNETFDGSGFDSKDAAMNAALADGKDKFTFDGKKFTIDNSAAVVADYTNSVLADVKADTDLRVKSDSEWGDLAGAQNAATARNTVAIGNAEANDLTEAAALAKIRDPSATSFTFDGKTYNVSASQSEMSQATRNATLAEIKDLPNFKDAYAQARTLLGPNQTFEWNGKQYSTATAAERPDLSGPSIDALNARNLSTVTDASNTVAAQTDMAARDAAAINTANLAAQSEATKPLAQTSFLGQIYKDLNNRLNLNGIAANEYLKNNPNSPITASVSSAFEAVGELQKNLGGVALAFDNKPLADTIIKGGNKLQEMGQSIGSAPEDTKNWKDTLDLIDKAKGTEKLAVLAGRVMDGTSGLARQVGLELRQELPALFLGGGSLKATMIASGLIDTADTGGGAVVEAYDNAVKSGKTHEEALSAGRKAGAAAAGTEAVIQATLGKLADIGAGKLDSIISKGTAKVAGEGVVEGSQEAGASAAVDLALGNTIDVNKALTQGVVGAAVGKGTAATTSPVDAATSTVTEVASATNTAATNVANNINTAIASGNTQNIGGVITENVTTSINSGASANAVVDSAVTTAVTGGADAAVAVDSAITSAISSGASVDTTIGSAVSSAVKAGADVNTVIQAATTAAASTGNNVTITSDANVVTVNNATTNTNTTVDTKTGVTTTVDNNTNTTTTVNGNTTTTVDTNANTNTQTTVDTNTNTTTSTTVNTNTNATTQTTITGNTQTTVLTDPTTNTQTTVKINTETGDVEDVKEVEIPSDWTPPVINTPEVKPPTVTTTPPTAVAEVTPEKTSKPKKSGKEGGAGGIGGAGLPLGIGVDPASLRSKVTGDAIDPLAAVKQAQAELERDVMMNQMDPRFLAAIQQRTNPNQQAQQLDTDVGALAKLLRGDSDAPANEGKYYSYGSEDSIDDILGGKAANYAAGGYVEPLKASGGSMALPLLAKSGGALGKYNGREDFKGGKHVAGDGDGQSDDIPAWLADGEFVFPADVVSALGNGSTKAGTDKLYEMMHNIRDRARSKGPKDLPPPALKSPLDYLKSSKRSAK